MNAKGTFFIGLFAVCCLAAFAEPFAGIIAYVVHYHTAPENQWWGASLAAMGVRYSYTISICLLLGTLFNLKKLPYGRAVAAQEALFLIYLVWMTVSQQMNGSLSREDPVDKMQKMAVFVLALTHIAVTPRRYNHFVWLIVGCTLYLGYEGFTAPAGAYTKGRLNGIGGPDFADSNALGAHVLALLAWVGIQFLRAHGRGKLICFVAAGLGANTVVATRSRAAFLGAAVGLAVALLFGPKGTRKRIWPLVIMGVVGLGFLVDKGFKERMGTLDAEERARDESAQDRLQSWQAGLRMAGDFPLGVGPGNFAPLFGRYLKNHKNRDAHNTYIRCLVELGVPGFVLFAAMVLNAFVILSRVRRHTPTSETTGHDPGAGRSPPVPDFVWHAFVLQLALSMYLVAGFFSSFNHVEMLWWLLMLPAAVERVMANSGTSTELTPGAVSPRR